MKILYACPWCDKQHVATREEGEKVFNFTCDDPQVVADPLRNFGFGAVLPSQKTLDASVEHH